FSRDWSSDVCSSDLVFDKADVQKLEAQLSWQNARFLAIDNWVNLGSFAARLSENGEGGVRAELFDLEGPIKVNGIANWHAANGRSEERRVGKEVSAG